MGSNEHYLQIRDTAFHVQRELVSFTWFSGYINNVSIAVQARAIINNPLKPKNSLYVNIAYIFTYNVSRLLLASIFLVSSSERF